jgi:type IV pilus assembly protein PilP
MKGNAVIVLFVGLLLGGCNANHEPLDEYIRQVESQARKEVMALAPVLEFQVAKYQGHQMRTPFVVPKVALVTSQPKTKKECWQPQPRRKTAKLERYPLLQLNLKGVMGSNGQLSALIQTPVGNVVPVKTGQFIGLNNGQVTRVERNFLVIQETFPDGLGCWDHRSIKLALK